MNDISISLHKIQCGDLFWESEQGQDALFIATTNARREGQGIVVMGREIPTGTPCRFFEHDRGAAYGPRIYTMPQYTRPDWSALLAGLAQVLREGAAEESAQAKVREDGLSLAATQYSESRDHWQQEARKAQRECERLRSLLAAVRDLTEQNLNGVTMGKRIQAILG